MWATQAGLERLVAALFEALEESVDSAARDVVVASKLSWAAVLQDDGIDDVAAEDGHAPPNLVVSTMSGDICPVGGETRHLAGALVSCLARHSYSAAPPVAQWAGISPAHKTTVGILGDQPPRLWSNRRSELLERLCADTCELCGS